jgi:hypothetical protein
VVQKTIEVLGFPSEQPAFYSEGDIILSGSLSIHIEELDQSFDVAEQFQQAFSSISFTQGELEIISSSFATTGSNTFVGNQIVSGTLNIATNSGDEGGEIQLGKAVTNTTIAGNSVVVDVFRDRVRIFEDGGSSRGAFLNVVSQSASVSSEIVTSPNIFSIQTISSASYAALTPPVSGTLYIII